MECLLRYLGDPGFQEEVGYDLGINQSSVSRAIHEVLERMEMLIDYGIVVIQKR